MFKLPKCPKRRKVWVEKINRGADWMPPEHAYLCEAHFEKSMYLRRIFDGWTRLKTTAVPTIFQHYGQQHGKEAVSCFPKETAILPDEGLTLRKESTRAKTKPMPSRVRKSRLNKRSRAAREQWARRKANQQRLQDTGHEKNNHACSNFTKSILKPLYARVQTFATKVPPSSNASSRSLLRFTKDKDAATQTDLPSTMRDKATATLLSLRDTGTDPMNV